MGCEGIRRREDGWKVMKRIEIIFSLAIWISPFEAYQYWELHNGCNSSILMGMFFDILYK